MRRMKILLDYARGALRGIGKWQGDLQYLVNEDLAKHDASLLNKPIYVSAEPCAAASHVDQSSRNKPVLNKCVTNDVECVVNKKTL